MNDDLLDEINALADEAADEVIPWEPFISEVYDEDNDEVPSPWWDFL